MCGCQKPSNMEELRDNIAGCYTNVVGWCLHNHKRKSKNITAANAIIKEYQIFKEVNTHYVSVDNCRKKIYNVKIFNQISKKNQNKKQQIESEATYLQQRQKSDNH